MTEAEFHLVTFEEIEASLQLREIEYRRPTRAKRLITKCPDCGADLIVTTRAGYVWLNCDNECLPGSILDALKITGALTVPKSPADLGAKHGNQVRIMYRFADEFAGRVVHVQGIGWFYYTGRHWKEDRGDKRVTEYVLQTERKALADSLTDPDLRKAVAACETSNGIAGVLRLAAAQPQLRADPEELNANPHLLNCSNVTFDLDDLSPRRHNPGDMLTQITEAAYIEPPLDDEDQDHKPGPWERFLAEVLPNEAVRDYLQRVVGMALIGRVEQHILPILTGVGANGKSTFIDAVLYALGSYAMMADPDLFTEGKTSSVGQVDLMGKRVAVVSETDKNAALAEGTVKRFTGGDKVKARKLYQDWVEFDPSHTVFMVTNHPPRVSGDDDAMWRRLRVIRFDVVVPPERRDGTLPDRLKRDAEAILAWAVQGLADYQAQGLDEPAEVMLATADYRQKSDHLGRFIVERCESSGPSLRVDAAQLFEEWNAWAAAEGCEPLSRRAFSEAVTSRRPEAGHEIKGVRSNGKRWFYGLGLKVKTDDD